MTLREVLKALQDQGLVEPRRGRYGGTFVRAPGTGQHPAPGRTDAAALEDTLRFREVLEVGAAELCAAHGLDAAGARRLRDALERTGDAPFDDYRRQDTLLHLTLSELAGSPP
ncbi:FadR/GntR family transcriptional regulator [Actinomadura keratinilytica]